MCVRFSYPTAALRSVRPSLRLPCMTVSVSSVHNKLNHILPHRLQHAAVREGGREVCPSLKLSLSLPLSYCIFSIYAHHMECSFCAMTLYAWRHFWKQTCILLENMSQCHASRCLFVCPEALFAYRESTVPLLEKQGSIGDLKYCTRSLCHGCSAHKRKHAHTHAQTNNSHSQVHTSLWHWRECWFSP